MKSFYYYMPPCPKCGSERTGRYVQLPPVNKNYMMIESLKNGEIIRFAKKIPERNAFCEDCEFEWEEDARLVRITEDEKEYEIKQRGTQELLSKYYEENKIDPDKKPILGGIFSGLTNFF